RAVVRAPRLRASRRLRRVPAPRRVRRGHVVARDRPLPRVARVARVPRAPGGPPPAAPRRGRRGVPPARRAAPVADPPGRRGLAARPRGRARRGRSARRRWLGRGPRRGRGGTGVSALVIRAARLVEPDGAASPPVDVTVRAGRVESVASAAAGAPGDAAVLDAGGRLLLPGFVDAHVHGEAAVLDEDVQLAMLRQGVTSVVVGQDGVSWAPSPRPGEATAGSAGTEPGGSLHDAAAWASGYLAAINGEPPTSRGGPAADLLATYDGTTRVNVGYLAPHGTIRYAVLGPAARPASRGEVDRMVALLAGALDDGALGMSTGLEYVPAAYADEAELVALTSVLAARGLPHVSHMRGYEDRAGPAFAELVRVARASGAATHVSHYHGPAAELLGYVDDARAQGLDVTFDT